ncbi:MAG: citrate synthase [Desulfobacterales bacterium]|jgi:citrate synthase|nr:citrate synthase [Desulfobacteraceae bacterium]MBT4363977.1 citrate synthase [Desulfobacteraceae bacterium]MBT7086229.1 citrate synthase [Desulfobacterales bacterium]
MEKTAKIIIDGKTYELPIILGSEGEKAIDIRTLRQKTGYITYDPGYGSTGSCKSSITYMDGEKGILRHRGIPIEKLAAHSTFVETSYLVINGQLPNEDELVNIRETLNDNSLVHEDMQIFFQSFPRNSHPMGILSAMVNTMRSFYPDLDTTEEEIDKTMIRLLSKVRTMAAMSYKISRGHKVVYPRSDYSYCANFLNMMFDNPVKPYKIDSELVRALNVFWILHADHEQNCSTSAVRVVGSGRVNVYATISAGIAALWGPLHGGANQSVIHMLMDIQKNDGDITTAIKKAKDKNDPFRLMGFGHRVYKTYDPRAKIMKKLCHKLLKRLKIDDPLLHLAMKLEKVALKDEYFVDHNLYPNVDFYSGIFLRTIGIPLNMFTVMFAIGRLPGWISQWKESMDDPHWRISRPRQIYSGETKRGYIPLSKR